MQSRTLFCMLHDYLAVDKGELDSFFAAPETYLSSSKKYFKHKNRIPSESISLKFDKFVFEKVKGYIKSQSPKYGVFSSKRINEMVEPHSQNKYLLKSDIRNYFESIKFEMVNPEINKCDAIPECLDEIKKIYFGKTNSLRRGLIASPAISEVVGLKIDAEIFKMLRRYFKNETRLTYSRYYDDLIFSSDDKSLLRVVEQKLKETIENLGLRISEGKTSVQPAHSSIILGLRLHGNEIVTPKFFRNRLRALIHQYDLFYGESSLEEVYDKLRLVGSIIGSLRYIVNNTTRDTTRFREYLDEFLQELERLEDRKNELIEQAEEDYWNSKPTN